MIAVFCIWLGLTLPSVHPIHISVSEVELKGEEINWSVRIYKDDLLRGVYGKVKDLSILDDHDKVSRDILSYISKSIIIEFAGTPLKWSLVDIQPDPEAIWVTVKTSLPGQNGTSFTVRNRVLMEIYKDQKNVVHFNCNTGNKNLVFERGDDEKVISF